MNIDIYTNEMASGWRPGAPMLAGSEEVPCELAMALGRAGHAVRVFGTVPQLEYNRVRYLPREAFRASDVPDALITWKDAMPWVLGAQAKRCAVHWSANVREARWLPNRLAAVVCLSRHHREQWLAHHGAQQEGLAPVLVSPLGVPDDWRISGKGAPWEKREELAVYTSSPDRGLVTLLQDWPLIKHHRPKAELVVTYGWGHFDAATRGDEDAQRFKGEVAELMRQDGVTYAGALDEGRLRDLLRQARWWVHPLNNPDGGLFCLSAVKAQLFNALPVVLHADDSGLADTVADYVPYAEWTRGNDLVIKRGAPAASAVSWEALVRQFWQPLLERKLDTTG